MKFWFVLLIMSAPPAAAQTKDSIAQVISNSPTQLHVQLASTKLQIIPPKGFQLSKRFTGFEMNLETFMEVEETLNESYHQQDIAGIKAAAVREGVTVLEHRHLKVGTRPGQYLLLQVSRDLKVYMLIFGDHEGCVKISASFPALNSSVESAIIRSFNSMSYASTK